MAKRGESKHLKRIALSKSVPMSNKKEYTWVINPSPGPHNKKNSIPLVIVIRDILGFAKTAREVRTILNSKLVSVDGVTRTEPDFPVGLFDIISFSKADKHYQIVVDKKARLMPKEIEKLNKKLLKVVGKRVMKKGKISLTLHDGKSIAADNHVKVGDTVLFNLENNKLEKVLKLEKGATCLITEGKHAGAIAKLLDVISRKEGKPSEAKLDSKDGEFITVAKYLFVVEKDFQIGAS